MKKGLFLGLALVVVLVGCGETNDKSSKEELLTPEEAKTKAQEFIENNLLQGQATANISKVSEENGLYKMKVEAGGQSIDSYMTKDGKKFFPQAMDMENPQTQTSSQGTTTPPNQQQQMSTEQQAQAIVPQLEQLLEQQGDNVSEEEKRNIEQKLQELKDLNSQENPKKEELKKKMDEVQKASQPLIEEMTKQQQGASPNQQQQKAPSPQQPQE